MKNKLKRVAAGVLAAVTVSTATGCEVVENPDFDSEAYYKYDNSKYDNYQVIYVESGDSIEPLLGKLYTTPISDELCYKKINSYEVIYEFNKETNLLKSNYEIVDILSITGVISDDYEIEEVYTDEEAISIFNKYVLGDIEKKLN